LTLNTKKFGARVCGKQQKGMKKYLIYLIAILAGCTDHVYKYNGVNYKVYSELNFKNPTSIHAVDLSYKDLIRVPESVYELENLIFLNLNFTKITQIENQLCNLDQLKILMLNGNRGIVLPECIYNMDLETLWLAGCFTQLDLKKFSTMKKLQLLVIGANKYSEEELQYLERALPNTTIWTSID
jgi:Leucine-rich repeat (LRR) protein